MNKYHENMLLQHFPAYWHLHQDYQGSIQEEVVQIDQHVVHAEPNLRMIINILLLKVLLEPERSEKN